MNEPNLGVEKPNGLPMATANATEVVGFELPSEAIAFLKELSDREIALKAMLQNCADMRVIYLTALLRARAIAGNWTISADGSRLVRQQEASGGQ